MKSPTIRQDFEWFMDNMPDFYKKYGPKFLAIKNMAVLGIYNSFAEAVVETGKTEIPGTYIIQECFESREKAVRHIRGNTQIVRAW